MSEVYAVASKDGGANYITKGARYRVLKEHDGQFWIERDDGSRRWYNWDVDRWRRVEGEDEHPGQRDYAGHFLRDWGIAPSHHAEERTALLVKVAAEATEADIKPWLYDEAGHMESWDEAKCRQDARLAYARALLAAAEGEG